MNKLTKDNEKKIDKMIKKINKITFSRADELLDFNQEFKSNLSLKIFDLEKEGNSQALATDIVIQELIQEKKSFKKEMKYLFDVIYSKKILYLSSVGIIISTIIMMFTLMFSYLNLFNESDIYILLS